MPQKHYQTVKLETAVAESVSLLDLIEQLALELNQAGLSHAFPVGARVMAKRPELMQAFEQCSHLGEVPDRMARLYGLYRQCREVINPVQSALQNLMRPRGNEIRLPEAAPWSVAPAQVLSAIIKAKESWTYLDTHPQVAIARTTGHWTAV